MDFNIKLGEQVLDGKVVIIEIQSNGYVRATFPQWLDTFSQPVYIEVTTVQLIKPILIALLPLHP